MKLVSFMPRQSLDGGCAQPAVRSRLLVRGSQFRIVAWHARFDQMVRVLAHHVQPEASVLGSMLSVR